MRTPPSAGKRLYIGRDFCCGEKKFEMGKWCEICETRWEQCMMPGGHALCGNGVVRQEILFGKHEEQRRVDVEKGRETKEFKWNDEGMMQSCEVREKWRAHGKAMAERLAGAREERIGKQKCGMCMVERRECEWPEVHFSLEDGNVAWCNEVGGMLECVVWFEMC